MQRLAPNVGVANISARLNWQGPFDIHALQSATFDFIQRHPYLRVRLDTTEDGELVQIVENPRPVEIQLEDVRHMAADDRPVEIRRLSCRAS